MIPSTWATLIKRGHTIRWAATIEGIPYVFTEEALRDVYGAALTLPTGYTSAVPALSIADGQAVSCEIDREAGVASGRAWDMQLAGADLEAAGVLAEVFRRPTQTATLATSDVTGAATTITVDSTSGWPSSGLLYAGLETISYTGKTATTFTGCTRGVTGRPMPLVASGSPSVGYRKVGGRPTQWRGRLVSLWAHLVSPEGRALTSAWCATDTYCVEVWAGYVDALPTWTASGIQIHALPLIRKLAQKVGADLSGTVWYGDVSTGTAGDFWLLWTPADAVYIQVELVGTGVVAEVTAPSDATYGNDTLGAWCALLEDELGTALGAGWEVWCHVGQDSVVLLVGHTTGNVKLRVSSGATWFLKPGIYGAGGATTTAQVTIPVAPGFTVSGTGWLPVRFEASESWQAADIHGAGVLEVTVGGDTEVVRWDETYSIFSGSTIFLHISARAGYGQRVDIWSPEAQVTVVTGSRAQMAQALGELWESSGLTIATRGSYDTLGRGYGLGMPGGRFDYSGLTTYPWGGQDVDAGGSDESPEDRVGGWFALVGQCLVQRSVAGAVVIGPVPTVPVSSVIATTISPSDALLSGHQPAELVEAPTEVGVEIEDGRKVIARDVPRSDAEGVTSWTLRAWGASESSALVWGSGLVALTDGQAVVQVRVGPWVPVRVGDTVTLTTAHPLVYDWATGAAGVAETSALVLGHGLDLVTCEQDVTLLLPGAVESLLFLAPSGVVVSVDSATAVTVTAGVGQYLAAGEQVYVYRPGNETASGATLTIASVSGDQVTFTAAHGLSIGDIVTYPTLSSASTAQGEWAYVDGGTVWR